MASCNSMRCRRRGGCFEREVRPHVRLGGIVALHREVGGLPIERERLRVATHGARAEAHLVVLGAEQDAPQPLCVVAQLGGKPATPEGDRPDEAAAIARDWAEAGATWWIEALWGAESVETVRQRVEQGPPRLP